MQGRGSIGRLKRQTNRGSASLAFSSMAVQMPTYHRASKNTAQLSWAGIRTVSLAQSMEQRAHSTILMVLNECQRTPLQHATANAMSRVFMYVVDRDFGFAPNPFHGY